MALHSSSTIVTSVLVSVVVQEDRAWNRTWGRGCDEPHVGVGALVRGDKGGVRGSSICTWVWRRTGGVILLHLLLPRRRPVVK